MGVVFLIRLMGWDRKLGKLRQNTAPSMFSRSEAFSANFRQPVDKMLLKDAAQSVRATARPTQGNAWGQARRQTEMVAIPVLLIGPPDAVLAVITWRSVLLCSLPISWSPPDWTPPLSGTAGLKAPMRGSPNTQ